MLCSGCAGFGFGLPYTLIDTVEGDAHTAACRVRVLGCPIIHNQPWSYLPYLHRTRRGLIASVYTKPRNDAPWEGRFFQATTRYARPHVRWRDGVRGETRGKVTRTLFPYGERRMSLLPLPQPTPGIRSLRLWQRDDSRTGDPTGALLSCGDECGTAVCPMCARYEHLVASNKIGFAIAASARSRTTVSVDQYRQPRWLYPS